MLRKPKNNNNTKSLNILYIDILLHPFYLTTKCSDVTSSSSVLSTSSQNVSGRFLKIDDAYVHSDDVHSGLPERHMKKSESLKLLLYFQI